MAKASDFSIYLATGHGRAQDGSWDCGCVYKGETEAALVLNITKAAAKYCRKAGLVVYTDADKDNNLNILTIDTANRLKVDAYVSIHCDFYKAPSGTYPIVHPNSKDGLRLAECINAQVKAGMNLKGRGIKKDGSFWEVRDTNMPATIFETGSIKADLEKLKDFDKYGKCIAKGICDYFGIPFIEKEPTPKKPSNGKWKQIWTYEENGKLVEGWKEIAGKWYYLEPAMAIGWKTIGKYKYYFHLTGGNMMTGWQKIDNKTYYFHPSGGNMMEGWQTIDGKTYYFYKDGSLAKDATIDGLYYVDENGVLLNSK